MSATSWLDELHALDGQARELRPLVRTRDGLRWSHVTTVERVGESGLAGWWRSVCSCGASKVAGLLSVATTWLDHDDDDRSLVIGKIGNGR